MLNQETLKQHLSYNPSTGLFTRLIAKSKAVKVGDIAGSKDKQGYITLMVCGKLYKAHRLVWLYMYGEWPKNEIDHINRNKADNRLCNLRDVEKWVNQHNRDANKTNKSGFKGVCRKGKKWSAVIKINKKTHWLGVFETAELANAARQKYVP
jgi:hypothetical protein